MSPLPPLKLLHPVPRCLLLCCGEGRRGQSDDAQEAEQRLERGQEQLQSRSRKIAHLTAQLADAQDKLEDAAEVSCPSSLKLLFSCSTYCTFYLLGR